MKRKTKIVIAGVCLLGAFACIYTAFLREGDDVPKQPWLLKAAREAETIVDPKARARAWWRIAAIAAEVADDELCAKAVANARRDIPMSQENVVALGDFDPRLVVQAKVAAGKVRAAKAIVADIEGKTPGGIGRNIWPRRRYRLVSDDEVMLRAA